MTQTAAIREDEAQTEPGQSVEHLLFPVSVTEPNELTE